MSTIAKKQMIVSSVFKKHTECTERNIRDSLYGMMSLFHAQKVLKNTSRDEVF